MLLFSSLLVNLKSLIDQAFNKEDSVLFLWFQDLIIAVNFHWYSMMIYHSVIDILCIELISKLSELYLTLFCLESFMLSS